jgi:hypothetical protein
MCRQLKGYGPSHHEELNFFCFIQAEQLPLFSVAHASDDGLARCRPFGPDATVSVNVESREDSLTPKIGVLARLPQDLGPLWRLPAAFHCGSLLPRLVP